jgi:hypothetical protein
MALPFDPKTLTPVLNFNTTAPFPEKIFVDDPSSTGPVIEQQPSKTKTVQLRICSEFVNHVAQATAFQSTSKIGFVLDSRGQPIVASIGSDNASYSLYILSSLFSLLIFAAPSNTSSCRRSSKRLAAIRYLSRVHFKHRPDFRHDKLWWKPIPRSCSEARRQWKVFSAVLFIPAASFPMEHRIKKDLSRSCQ